MFGSLDCMHIPWKNCPMAWKGSYTTGKDKKTQPTLVLEALCDYNLWFWHAAFGFAGSLNDINILNLSPLLESLLDGSFAEIERNSKTVPYVISGEVFHLLNILVDGIYPKYSRFIKTLNEPVTRKEVRFTNWQESSRKDIERAFGVFQSMFQTAARPITTMDLNRISGCINAILILHNMAVSDRVMEGDVYARYYPAHSLEIDANLIEEIDYPEDFDGIAGQPALATIGLRDGNPQVIEERLSFWKHLTDRDEHARLNNAVIHHVANTYISR